MTREEIIKFAREAGLGDTGMRGGFIFFQPGTDGLERFAALIAAAEREACASICFQEGPSIDGELIAEAIRKRGQEK